MNKKIKITIACLLSISGLALISPEKFSILTKKAYADVATYSLADSGELKYLDVQSTDGKSLELCDDYGGNEKNLTDDKTYYVTLDSNSDGVKIFAEAAGDDYVTKVFESDRGNSTAHDLGEEISVEKGVSTLYIRTFTSEDALKRAEKNEDVTNCDKTYKININKITTDEIYLEKLTLDSGNIPINFNRDTCSYNVSIPEDSDDVIIRAVPEEVDDTVKINGFKANYDNSYKKDLHLHVGTNVVKVYVTNDYDKLRTYTVNITRGTASATNNLNTNTTTTTTSETTNNSETVKYSQWVQANNKWQYNDATGTSLKNVWFYDKNGGKNYYLQADGNIATGWLSNNGKWYYLGIDGAMKIGWQLINGTWYYLDSQGAMAYNTKVDGYKLGSDGAWVK